MKECDLNRSAVLERTVLIVCVFAACHSPIRGPVVHNPPVMADTTWQAYIVGQFRRRFLIFAKLATNALIKEKAKDEIQSMGTQILLFLRFILYTVYSIRFFISLFYYYYFPKVSKACEILRYASTDCA